MFRSAPIRPPSPVRSGITVSTWEGCFANAFSVITDVPYLTAFALSLSATNKVIAFIGGLTFLARVFQLVGAFLVERYQNRKRISLIFGALNRLLWIVPALTTFFLPLPPKLQLSLFSIIVFVSSVSGMILNNSWMSWAGDLIPSAVRPKYFGFRLSVMAMVSVAATLTTTTVLDVFRDPELNLPPQHGFAVMFLVASAFGAVTIFLFKEQYEPPFKPTPAADPREMLLAPLRNALFRPLLLFFLIWNAGTGIAAVFYTAQMITVLKMSYLQIGFYTIIITLGRVIMNPVWGSIIDRFGAVAVLKLSAVIVGLTPFLWLFATPTFLLPVWIDACVSAVAMVGLELATMDVQFAESPKQGRTYYFAWYGLTSGIGFFAASLLGGTVADLISGSFITIFTLPRYTLTLGGYHWIFLAAILIRFTAITTLIRMRPNAAEHPILLAAHFGRKIVERLYNLSDATGFFK
ncbi:MAG: MFS transporter [Rhizobacter sp.]|nr:MFS transporter [Chlorobiales bacterium]